MFFKPTILRFSMTCFYDSSTYTLFLRKKIKCHTFHEPIWCSTINDKISIILYIHDYYCVTPDALRSSRTEAPPQHQLLKWHEYIIVCAAFGSTSSSSIPCRRYPSLYDLGHQCSCRFIQGVPRGFTNAIYLEIINVS